MFAHRLVEAGVGGRTVDQLNENMTVSEFLRWKAYDQMFPMGFTDLQFGKLRHLLASIYSQKGHEPKLNDYLLGELPEKEVTPEELEAKFNQIATAGGLYDEN